MPSCVAISCSPMFWPDGGVTFTGGEPTLQFEPLAESLRLLHDAGINTALESNASHRDLPLLFDTAIADALVLGPLRTESVVLSDEALDKIRAYNVDAKTERLMITLAEYYIANKEPDCEWVIMPRTNISAYLGSASYMEMYESRIPEGFMEKKPEMGGVSAVRVNI